MTTFTPLSALPSRKKDVDEMISSQFRKELISTPVTFVGARNDEAKFVAHKSQFVPINAMKKAPVATHEVYEDKKRVEKLEKKSDMLKMQWERVYGVSKGLSNFGNTCFMNSALQCLMNSAALVQLLLEEEKTVCVHGGGRHGALNGNSQGRPGQAHGGSGSKFCCYCELKKLVIRNYGANRDEKTSIRPTEMAVNLRSIGATFRAGRQEDSHEFLRELIAKSDEAAAKHSKRLLDVYERPIAKLLPGESPPPTPKPSSQLFALFGSFLRSRVTCGKCGYHSDTFDPYMDISVELTSHSLERCLRHFTAPEQLDLDNMYKCGSCQKKSQPVKRIQLWQPPNLLTIHLKRFNIFGKKINKEIQYPETLDLSPYFCAESPHKANSTSSSDHTHASSHPSQHPKTPSIAPSDHIYRLYAVLLHHGPSSRSGHYTAVVKASNGIWTDANDSYMSKSSLKHALSHTHDAYILFYARENGSIPPTRIPASIASNVANERRLSQLQDKFLKGDSDDENQDEEDQKKKKQSNGAKLASKASSTPHANGKSSSTMAITNNGDSDDDSEGDESINDDSSSLGSSADSDASDASDDDISEESTDSDGSDSEESSPVAKKKNGVVGLVSSLKAHSKASSSDGLIRPPAGLVDVPSAKSKLMTSLTNKKKPLSSLDLKARQAEALKMLFGGHVSHDFTQKQIEMQQQEQQKKQPKSNPALRPKKVRENYDAAIWKSKALYGGSQVANWSFEKKEGEEKASKSASNDSSKSPSKTSEASSMDVDLPVATEEDGVLRMRKMHNRAMGDLQLVAKEHKKRVRSDYDIDYDRGHVKKVKRKEDDSPSSSGSYRDNGAGKSEKGFNKFQSHSDGIRSGAKSAPHKSKNFKGGADRVKRLQQDEKKKKQHGNGEASGPNGKKYFKKAFWKGKGKK